MFGRLRAPVVITTTVHANADELQVSTTVEENTDLDLVSGRRSNMNRIGPNLSTYCDALLKRMYPHSARELLLK